MPRVHVKAPLRDTGSPPRPRPPGTAPSRHADHSNAVLYGVVKRRATRVPPCCAQRRPQRRAAASRLRTASAAGASTALGGTAEAKPTRGWATRTGKEEDVEVGLYYFGKRYLNPLLGRWVSADPAAIHTFRADANAYAYVHASILSNIDPMGLDPAPAPAAGMARPTQTPVEYARTEGKLAAQRYAAARADAEEFANGILGGQGYPGGRAISEPDVAGRAGEIRECHPVEDNGFAPRLSPVQ